MTCEILAPGKTRISANEEIRVHRTPRWGICSMTRSTGPFRTLRTFSLLLAAVSVPWFARAQAPAQSPRAIVSTVVNNEVTIDAADHSRWMYRDVYKSPEKDNVKLVIQTAGANLSETIEDHGQPVSAQEHAADLNRNQEIISDPALRARMRRNEAHDGQQADELTRMLPYAFNWTIVSRQNGDITLAYHPDPNFSPPSMSARVFASMTGTLVVDEHAMRLKVLTGRLTQAVNFGWGIFGHLDAGGTFVVIRSQIGPGIWQITQTHVHISGHALFFKSIGDQEDEVTTDYKPVPDSIDMNKAAEMIRSGQLAREFGVPASSLR